MDFVRCPAFGLVLVFAVAVFALSCSTEGEEEVYDFDDDDDGEQDAGVPARALDPEGDPDRDGVTTLREQEAGTNPLDPASAPAWHPEWSGHPRLLFDLETWQLIKQAVLSGDPSYAPYYKRLKAYGQRSYRPHQSNTFDPRINEENTRTALGAAVVHAVEEDPELLEHFLEVMARMRTDVWPLSYENLAQATIHTSRAMMNLCEAYDLLEGVRALDKDSRALVRGIIRELAANWYELHVGFGSIILQLTQNNHNIKGAAGMAYVGMTLNDLPEAAAYVNYGLTDAWYFLTDYQNSAGGGQAEGPAYLAYSALNYLPAFWAYHRFADGRAYPYRVECANRLERCASEIVDLGDPVARPELFQIHRWWHRIAMPDGSGPNIDDANLNCFFSGTASAMTGDPVLAWRDGALPSCSGYEGGLEMLRLALAHRIPEPREPQWMRMDVLEEAGQAVFRSSWSEDAVYGLMIAEHGNARLSGRGHEQPDATSLLVAAYGEYLLIDSGYISWDERLRVARSENHNLVLVDGRGPPNGFLGLGVDADAYLTHCFSRVDLAGVRARSGWQGCEVIRDVFFSGDARFYVADRLLCPGQRNRRFTLLWHANAGGTASGIFLLKPDGLTAIREEAKIQVRVAACEENLAASDRLVEHAMIHSQPLTHNVFRADSEGNDMVFVSSILPRRFDEDFPGSHVVRAGPDAVAEIVSGEGFLEWFGSTRGDDVMAFDSHGGVRAIETDAQTAFLRLSEDGSTVLDYQLVEGSFLVYDNVELP